MRCKLFKWLILVFFILTFYSCEKSKNYSIAGEWEFIKGFNLSYLQNSLSDNWTPLSVPSSLKNMDELKGYQGSILLRKKLTPDICQLFETSENVIFRSGTISPAAIFYFNQQIIGKLGSIQPYESGTNKELLTLCPGSAFNKNGDNFIYMELLVTQDVEYIGFKGPKIQIGEMDSVYKSYYFDIIFAFVYITIYFSVGFHFLLIWIRRRQELYYLFFSLFFIVFIVFFLVNTEAKKVLIDFSPITMVKMDQVSLMLLSIFFSLFIIYLLNKKITKTGCVLTVLYTLYALIDLFGSEKIISFMFLIWNFTVILTFIYLIYITIINMKGRNVDAYIILVTLILIALTTIYDNMVNLGLWGYVNIGRYVYISIIICLGIIQSNRLVIVYNKLEELNQTLEEKVRERTIEIQEMIIQLKEKNLILEKTAFNDSLTGLYNHATMLERLQEIYSEAKRYLYPICIIMIDIDNFKSINDNYGHQTGDHIIIQVASVLRYKSRQYDIKFKIDENFNNELLRGKLKIAGRYGGDEFIIIFPHCGKEEITIIAERIILQIREIRYSDYPDIKITCSLGVGILNNYTYFNDIKQLIKLADMALYQSKRKGKDRISYLEFS